MSLSDLGREVSAPHIHLPMTLTGGGAEPSGAWGAYGEVLVDQSAEHPPALSATTTSEDLASGCLSYGNSHTWIYMRQLVPQAVQGWGQPILTSLGIIPCCRGSTKFPPPC